MSRTLGHAAQTLSTDKLLTPLTVGASLLERVCEYSRQAHSRKVLNRLTERQLGDAGIDRSTIGPSRPVIEIEAGLMARLMSLR